MKLSSFVTAVLGLRKLGLALRLEHILPMTLNRC